MTDQILEEERYTAETAQIAANTEQTKAHTRLMNAQAAELEDKNKDNARSKP